MSEEPVVIDIVSQPSSSSKKHVQAWTDGHSSHLSNPRMAPSLSCMERLSYKCGEIKTLELERSHRGTLPKLVWFVCVLCGAWNPLSDRISLFSNDWFSQDRQFKP